MSDEGPVTDPEADTEVLDEQPRSILLALISQLRKGMDLHRVTLPTFVLEPRSMLERITDFMAHPDLFIAAPLETDGTKRFLQTLKYYLSGWHIRPKGVKKPYNPVLGEFFRCKWKLENGTEAFYVAEQVSHHPPISAYYYASPENGVSVYGEFRPKSKFLGNSAATLMTGSSTVVLTGCGQNGLDEEYTVTYPNVYAKGLLFGTMYMELGDTAEMKCNSLDLLCEMEFTTKGFFSGTYNGIKGKIKRISSGEVLYNLTGKWTDVIYIQKNERNAPQVPLFEVDYAKISQKQVLPESEQDEYESRRLWTKLTAAMLKRDMDLATDEKTKVEDAQRKLRGEREDAGIQYKGKYFECNGDVWTLQQLKEVRAKGKAQDAQKRVSEIIFGSKK